MTKETGGPAFPTQTYDHGAAMNGIGVTITDDPGMTLRDYFSGQALSGMCADETATNGMPKADIAKWCYEMADAMLEARK